MVKVPEFDSAPVPKHPTHRTNDALLLRLKGGELIETDRKGTSKKSHHNRDLEHENTKSGEPACLSMSSVTSGGVSLD